MNMRKYLENGREVEVETTLVNGGFVVYGLYEDDDGNEIEGHIPEIVSRVFDKPPTEKLDAKLKELQESIETCHSQLGVLHKQIAQAKSTDEIQLKKWKQHKALENLDKFLDGKLTHYVTKRWTDYEILAAKNALCSSGDWTRPTKLLCLFGESNGNLEWKLNDYRDGSGSWGKVYPCTSEAEALAKVKELIECDLETSMDNPSGDVITNADKYGVAVPIEYREKVRSNKIEAREKQIGAYMAEIEKVKAEIEALKK